MASYLMSDPRVSIVIPAYQEGERIVGVLHRIQESVEIPFECLVVVDFEEDSTIKFVEDFDKKGKSFKIVLNQLGQGPANAIKAGIQSAVGAVIVVTMADGSDDPELIEPLVRLVERGVAVAAASRYMPGGQQVGAPFFKALLSRLAGLSLRWIARVGTHDATNSYKAYESEFVKMVGIHSSKGFEIGLELTVKAKRLGKQIAEIPTIWLERQEGTSNFKLFDWLPHYLKWYFFAFGKRISIAELSSKFQSESKINKKK